LRNVNNEGTSSHLIQEIKQEKRQQLLPLQARLPALPLLPLQSRLPALPALLMVLMVLMVLVYNQTPELVRQQHDRFSFLCPLHLPLPLSR
jgi:hypothetical protein